MEQKQPKVTLLEPPKNAMELIYLAWEIEKCPDNDLISVESLKERVDEDELARTVEFLCKQEMRRPLEFVDFVFKLENVTRAFQQQITRHRVGWSFSCQTLRMLDVGHFAEDGNYLDTTPVTSSFSDAMLSTQEYYRGMIEHGTKIEDARGILPLNIFSSMLVKTSFLGLFNFCTMRMCPDAQGEIRQVSDGFKREIAEKVSPKLAALLRPKCDYTGYCTSFGPTCGRWQDPPKEIKDKDLSKYAPKSWSIKTHQR